MRRIETDLPGVAIVEPRVFEDERGFFLESYHQGKFTDIGIVEVFVQDNHSASRRGTIRGLHYQLRHPQAKLCRVVEGAVLDVVVDIRRGSPTLGRWIAVELSAANHREIFVPRGFAHGFSVLSEQAQFLYKCSDLYHPEDEYGIRWDDPGLKIDWRVTDPVVSAKDRAYPTLAELPADRLPVYAT